MRKICTLTIFASDELAEVRMAERAERQAEVFWVMLPLMSVPSAVAGSWPETKIRVGVRVAWDCEEEGVRDRGYWGYGIRDTGYGSGRRT